MTTLEHGTLAWIRITHASGQDDVRIGRYSDVRSVGGTPPPWELETGWEVLGSGLLVSEEQATVLEAIHIDPPNSPAKPTYPDLLAFAAHIADLKRNGDPVDDADEDEGYVMENDDAVDTADMLIDWARELLAGKESA